LTGLDKHIIRERMKTVDTWVTPTRTAIAGAAVPESHIRYVVLITLSGDGAGTNYVDIEKLEEDGTTYTMLFSTIPIAPADFRQIPLNLDIEQSIIELAGGTRLYAKVTGNSVNLTCKYWDDEI